MDKIVRTKKKAAGGITKEEKINLKEHADMWIKHIMRTDPIEPDKIILSIKKLYKVSGLKEPRVVIVPSPFVGRLASGIAASVWYLRKNRSSDATYDATRAATDDATCVATDDATRAATRAATYDATCAATYAATYDATRAATDDATRAATYDATDDATRAATRAATYDATCVATRDATYDATRAATDDATRAATRAATYAATYDATCVATYDATDDATCVATDDATYDATWLKKIIKTFTPNSIKFTIGVIRLSYRFYQGGNMWGQYDSYLTAIRDVIGLTDLGCWENYQAWEDASKESGFRYMHEEFCIVSDFPEVLKVNERNQPHCSDGPSHRWRDGFEIYHLNGIRFEKETYYKVIAGMSAEDILKIEDVDQRAQAWRYSANPLDSITKMGGRILDEFCKTRIDGAPVRYFLSMIPQGEIFQKDAYFMVYDDAELLGEKMHMQGVPPHKTVPEAMAWKRSNEWSTMTPEEWKEQVIGVDHT